MCMRNRLNLFPFFFSALYGAFVVHLVEIAMFISVYSKHCKTLAINSILYLF